MSEPQALEPPDTHFVSAAVGWLELGNLAEAKVELDQVSAANQTHPDVLEVRWQVAAEQKDWPAAFRASTAILETAPDRASAWLHHAYAMRRMPEWGIEKAFDALRPAFGMFPDEAVIPFNLACYTCQMNRLPEAREWLAKAMAIGGHEKITQMALADADLEPLWKEIA